MDDIVKLANEQYEESERLTNRWRILARDDIAFAAGDQWDPQVARWRAQDMRPMLTIDRIEAAVSLIVGQQKANDLEIKVALKSANQRDFRSVDGQATMAYHDVLAGLVREIQQRSSFDSVMSTAFEHMVVCGLGAWTVDTEYAPGLTFDQQMLIRKVINPLSVYPDVAARWMRLPRYTHIVETMTADEYRAKFGEQALGGFAGDVQSSSTRDGVMLSQWYTVEQQMVPIVLVRDPLGNVQTLRKDELKKLCQCGAQFEVIREREYSENTVYRRLINGSEVLEETKWPGRLLPVVTLFGVETVHDGEINWRGIVRKAKDPQRVYNLYRSAVAEMMGAAPKSPWMVTDEMIRDYEDEWAAATIGNKPYMRFRPDPRLPGGVPQRNQLAYPSGFAQEAMIAADDIKATTKVWDASLGARSNETSGSAIRARQSESSMGNYWFADALINAVEYTGHVIIDAIPGVYDNSRDIMIRKRDGEQVEIRINTDESNSIDRVEAGIEVTTGPAFSTQRQEAASAMTELARVAPEMMKIGGDIWIRNQDWPGADELADRVKKTIPPQLLDDGDPLKMVATLQQQLQAANGLLAKLMGQAGDPVAGVLHGMTGGTPPGTHSALPGMPGE